MSIPTGNPALQAQKISGTLAGAIVRQSKASLERFMPLTTVDADDVVMDISMQRVGGMAPFTVPGTSSPIMPLNMNGGARVKVEAIEIREKVRVDAKDFRSVRTLGTYDVEESVEKIVGKYAVTLKQRLARRMEWMRTRSLFYGTMPYTFANTAEVFTMTFPHPAYLEPTTSTAWSNVSATIMSDLATWARLMDNAAGDDQKYTVIIPTVVASYMRLNTEMRDLYKNRWQGGASLPSLDLLSDNTSLSKGITAVLQQFMGSNFEVVIYDGEVLNYAVTLNAEASNATVIELDTVAGMSVGDTVVLQDRVTQARAEKVISSINTSTKAVTLTAQTGVAFPAGSMFITKTPLMPTDKIIIASTPDLANSDLGNSTVQGLMDSANPILPSGLGTVVSTRNQYNVYDNSPGYFGKMIIKTDDDPEYAEIIGGIMAIPKMDYPEYFVRADVIP